MRLGVRTEVHLIVQPGLLAGVHIEERSLQGLPCCREWVLYVGESETIGVGAVGEVVDRALKCQRYQCL